MDSKRKKLVLPDDLMGHILTKVKDTRNLANFSAVCKAFHAIPWPTPRLEGTSAVIKKALLSKHVTTTSIQELHIRIREADVVKGLEWIEQTKAIMEISLVCFTDIGDIWSFLENIPRLSSIQLGYVKYSPGLSASSSFPALKTAILDGIRGLTGMDIQNLLRGAPLLEELQICRWIMEHEQQMTIEGGSLKKLTISVSYSREVTELTVAGCVGLQELSVSKVDSLHIRHKSCPGLRKLHLKCITTLTNEKLRAFSCLRELQIEDCSSITFIETAADSLDKLHISYEKPTTLRVKYIALETLRISDNCRLLEMDSSPCISRLTLDPGGGRPRAEENLISFTRLQFVTLCLKPKMGKTIDEKLQIASLFISMSPCLATIIIYLEERWSVLIDLRIAIKHLLVNTLLSPQLRRIRFRLPGTEKLEKIERVVKESRFPGFSLEVISGHSKYHVDVIKT